MLGVPQGLSATCSLLLLCHFLPRYHVTQLHRLSQALKPGPSYFLAVCYKPQPTCTQTLPLLLAAPLAHCVHTALPSNDRSLCLPGHTAGIRQLADDSLGLLKDALYDPRFPALFDLRVWGSIIGMFELNNLNLFVPSPIQRWQGLIENVPDSEREPVLEDVGELRAEEQRLVGGLTHRQ